MLRPSADLRNMATTTHKHEDQSRRCPCRKEMKGCLSSPHALSFSLPPHSLISLSVTVSLPLSLWNQIILDMWTKGAYILFKFPSFSVAGKGGKDQRRRDGGGREHYFGGEAAMLKQDDDGHPQHV